MAKSIMVQGTMSNAGKSLLAAGLCRIFKQDGYRVAPFKSQNMALNSFITREGLEMGRAQVMQAEAAGIEPSVLMNPILLKPTNDTGSQVIVNGEVLSTMSARDYFKYKKQLVPDIMKAYHALEEQADIIVLEGAGSPAEINLKNDDIVNMGMAKMANAPVLCSKPVVGVAPYMDIDVEDEDSLSERMSDHKEIGQIDLAVIRLPRISNFTDFNIFESIPGVSVRYISRAAQLGHPDLILIPGTKNTMHDLAWMRQSGVEASVLKAHASGCPVFGICGGYQMLGEYLEDPHGVEEGGSMRGMGLLPMRTVFTEEKTRTRVDGTFSSVHGILQALSGVAFSGYEIHMGQSIGKEGTDTLTEIHDTNRQQGEPAVCERKSEGAMGENVYGTYVHGIFDSMDVVNAVVRALAERKGIDPEGLAQIDYAAYKEQQYDKMAAILRQYLDMEAIYRIVEAGV